MNSLLPRLGLGTQPRYEAPGDLCVKIDKNAVITNRLVRLFPWEWPEVGKLAMGQHGVLHGVTLPPLNISTPLPTPHSKVLPLLRNIMCPQPLLLQFSGMKLPIPWFIELPLVRMKCSPKYNLLGICKIYNITNSKNLDCHMWFQ